MNNNEETIRFPTNLNRKQIETRLAQLHAIAVQHGLKDVADTFADVPAMSAANIRAAVLGTLTLISEKADKERERYNIVARSLEMIALNLKNL
jgi:hypothetical protein